MNTDTKTQYIDNKSIICQYEKKKKKIALPIIWVIRNLRPPVSRYFIIIFYYVGHFFIETTFRPKVLDFNN